MKKFTQYILFAFSTLFLTACSSHSISENEQGYQDYQKIMQWKENHKRAFFAYGAGLNFRSLAENKAILSQWREVIRQDTEKLQIKDDLVKQYRDKSLQTMYSLLDMMSPLLEENHHEANRLKALSDKYAEEADRIEQQLHQKFAK